MGCGASRELELGASRELALDFDYTVTLPSYSASHADHAKHVWVTIKLPPLWTSEFRGGALRVTWKDQGWGNRKGHLWARVPGDATKPWTRLSTHVAAHSWRTETLKLPAGWFARFASSDGGTLELACEIGGGGGHQLFVKGGGVLSLERGQPVEADAQPPAAVPSVHKRVPEHVIVSGQLVMGGAAVGPVVQAVAVPM